MDDTTREAMQIMEEINSPIETVMMEMMDRGYVLHGKGGEFSLTKVATDSDVREEINPGSATPNVRSGFPSRAHALKWYWDHRDDPIQVQKRMVRWTGQMAYNNGLGPKFLKLEDVEAEDHASALLLAIAQAETWVNSTQERKKWGYQQVKVRPAEA